MEVTFQPVAQSTEHVQSTSCAISVVSTRTCLRGLIHGCTDGELRTANCKRTDVLMANATPRKRRNGVHISLESEIGEESEKKVQVLRALETQNCGCGGCGEQ